MKRQQNQMRESWKREQQSVRPAYNGWIARRDEVAHDCRESLLAPAFRRALKVIIALAVTDKRKLNQISSDCSPMRATRPQENRPCPELQFR